MPGSAGPPGGTAETVDFFAGWWPGCETKFFLVQTHRGCFAERELSQLAACRQFARAGRFSARANTRAAVWDKPRSGSDAPALVSRPTLGKYMWVTHPQNPFHGHFER